VTEAGDRSTISAGDRVLMAILDADAKFEGVDRKTLAEIHRLGIAQGINAYRRERSLGVLFEATLYAVGATLALAMVLFAGNKLFRRLDAVGERYVRSKMDGVQIPLHRIQADRLSSSFSAALRVLRTMAILVIGFLYADFVLGLYPWTRQTAQHLLAILFGPVGTIGKSMVVSVPSLLFLVILVVAVRYTLTLMRVFFEGIENRTFSFSGFDQDWAMPTYQIARVLVCVRAGGRLPLRAGIGFGCVQGRVRHPGSDFSPKLLFGNCQHYCRLYTLTYRRAYKVGDRVKIGDAFGDVAEIRLQATFLRSLKNEEIIIPNSEALKTSVINYSSMAKKSGLILHTTVGIGYETPWRQVETMLLESAQRTPGLLRVTTSVRPAELPGRLCHSV
jgi:hypothetical protein